MIFAYGRDKSRPGVWGLALVQGRDESRPYELAIAYFASRKNLTHTHRRRCSL